MTIEQELELINEPGFRVVIAAVSENETALYGLVPGVIQWRMSPAGIDALERARNWRTEVVDVR